MLCFVTLHYIVLHGVPAWGTKHLSELQALGYFVVKRSLVDFLRELNTDDLLLFTCKLDHHRSVQNICWAAEWLSAYTLVC